MAVTGKGKQLASDPPSRSGSGSKHRTAGSDAGPSSSYKAAAKRSRREGVLQFFDDVAGVDDEYEEEEEPKSEEDFDDDEDGFVPELPRKTDNNRRPERSHSLPFLGHVKEEELSDDDELKEFVRQCYSTRVRYAGGASTQHDDDDDEFTQLNEPIIWRVKCTVGRERQMAFCLMQKFVDLKKCSTKVPIISAFSLDHVRGFVFVEAEKACDVTQACKGSCNVYVNGRLRSSPVPAAEVPSLLSPRAKPCGVSTGTWVRMKAGNYKGDLAQVVGVDDGRKRVLIKLIPRVDLRAISKKIGGAISLKRAAVPEPRLISSQELELFAPHIVRRRDRQTGDVFEVLDSLMFKDGFLYKRVALSSLIYWGIQPTDIERVKFSSSPSTKTSADDMEWVSSVYAYQAQEDGDARPRTTEEAIPQTTGEASVERTEQRPRKAGAPPNQEKEGKRPKKGAALEGALERYIDMKIQQAQDEAAVLAREKELVQANDFSIRRCISILTKTTLPPDEKVKASEVFQIPANRETFISFNDDDPEIALLWLRGKVDNL